MIFLRPRDAGAALDHFDDGGEVGVAAEFRIGQLPLIEHGAHHLVGTSRPCASSVQSRTSLSISAVAKP